MRMNLQRKFFFLILAGETFYFGAILMIARLDIKAIFFSSLQSRFGARKMADIFARGKLSWATFFHFSPTENLVEQNKKPLI